MAGGGGDGGVMNPPAKMRGAHTTATDSEQSTRARKKRRDDATWAYCAKSVTYLVAWSLVSGLIILLNNWIMHYDGFPFPITLSATGPLCSWAIAALLVLSGHTRLERRVTFRTWVLHIFPIGVFTAITYAAGNELYMFLSVSFIQAPGPTPYTLYPRPETVNPKL